MTQQMQMLFTFIILVTATALFVQGKIRSDLISLTALLALSLGQILTPNEALSGFSNPVVIMIAGLFVVGAGVFNSGLAEKLGNRLLELSGGSEIKLFLIVMLTASVFSGLLSSTGTVAVLLPLVMSMALKQQESPSRFLLPLAYASSLGGVLTLISTPSNMIVSNLLESNDFERLSFWDFTPIGLAILAAGLLFMLTAGRRLLPDDKVVANNSEKELSPSELAGMYKVYDRLHFVTIPGDSNIVGDRLSDLLLPVRYEITVIEILRNGEETISAKADEVLHPDDVILVFGEEDSVKRLAADYELELLKFSADRVEQHFLSSEFGLTEILIVPHSDFENQTLRDVHFREKYQCSVLAINRKGEYIQADVGTEQLRPGDALLVHGEWENIARISADLQDVIVIGSTSEVEPVNTYPAGKAKLAAGIVGVMLILLSLNVIPPVLSILTAAFLMIVSGCVRSMEEAYGQINWESVVLIAAMLPLSEAMEKTGGTQLVSEALISALWQFGPYGLLIGFYLLTMALGQFISNAATAIIIAPVAFAAAMSLQLSPYPFLICIAVAASMAFSTPVASPTNALVMTAAEYRYRDFALIGILLQIFIGVIMIFTIPIFFPFNG
ncbi:SLC13 family permease [Peribacillus sp. SCS-155]|uniref:SLC13 family permease n=1 Tax=Peribacillus sedimenti TaxID=3115297 RepID=UPI0039065079